MFVFFILCVCVIITQDNFIPDVITKNEFATRTKVGEIEIMEQGILLHVMFWTFKRLRFQHLLVTLFRFNKIFLHVFPFNCGFLCCQKESFVSWHKYVLTISTDEAGITGGGRISLQQGHVAYITGAL